MFQYAIATSKSMIKSRFVNMQYLLCKFSAKKLVTIIKNYAQKVTEVHMASTEQKNNFCNVENRSVLCYEIIKRVATMLSFWPKESGLFFSTS